MIANGIRVNEMPWHLKVNHFPEYVQYFNSIPLEYSYLCDYFVQVEAVDGLLQCAMAVGPVGQ